MSTPQLERLREQCQRLRLYQIEQELTTRLEQAAKKELSYADFLDQLFACEVDAKTYKHHQMRIAMARFPFQKTLESFDFKFQPSVDQKLVRELATGRFVANAENALLFGPPGVGKTHLAIALGRAVVESGHSVLFVNATALLASLIKAQRDGKLDEQIHFYTKSKLLIVDELGYLPLERNTSNHFFQLVSRRYEKGSMLITTNQTVTQWGQVFGDDTIAAAVLDRLLHHSHTLLIQGESYRLRQKKKAGVISSESPAH